MKLWIDDVRPAPDGYVWVKSVEEARDLIRFYEDPNTWPCYCPPARHNEPIPIELIDIDHDAGDYAVDGGDYIKILEWFERTGRNYPIRIHSMNPVGTENMRRIIKRNGWTEVR